MDLRDITGFHNSRILRLYDIQGDCDPKKENKPLKLVLLAKCIIIIKNQI